MTKLAIPAVLLTALLWTEAASAQSRAVPYNQTYCMDRLVGKFTMAPMQCRYQTMAQCQASRDSPMDFCYIHPALGPRPGTRR